VEIMTRMKIRLLPLLMGAMALLLTVKLGDLWHVMSVEVGTPTEAQTQAQNPPAQNPPAQNPPAQTQPPATPAPGTQQAATQPPAAQQPAAPAAGAPAAGAPAATPAAGAAPAADGVSTAAPQGEPNAGGKTDSAAAVDPFNYTDEEVDVLQQLAKRRTELDARARQLDEREALVTAAEQKMDQKMAELKAMQSTIQDLLKQRSAAEETQLQSLVKIYENMKPAAAAGVFEELDMDILLDVVSRMKERKVAPILALMTPTRAKELTFELAQRQQLPVAP
jgi:flagellar motility protein MotE (MotC chaperone)